MVGPQGEMAQRGPDAEGGVLQAGDEQEEAEVEDLVLAVGPVADAAADHQRDQVVARAAPRGGRSAPPGRRRARGGVQDVHLGGALHPAVHERVGPLPEHLVALEA